jgi:hypothetical protein
MKHLVIIMLMVMSANVFAYTDNRQEMYDYTQKQQNDWNQMTKDREDEYRHQDVESRLHKLESQRRY